MAIPNSYERIYMSHDGLHIEGSRLRIRQFKEAIDKALAEDTARRKRIHALLPVDVHPSLVPGLMPIIVEIVA